MSFPRSNSYVQLPTGRNYIGGEWLDDAAAERLPVYDPATEAVIGDIPCSTAAAVDQAVQAARAAFVAPAWRDLPPLGRERLIHRLAELIETNAAELAAIEALDNGKPIAFASTVDVPLAAMWLRYMAGWPSKLGGKSVAPALQPAGSHHAYTIRQPVGVVAAIVPWNYPLVLAVWKIAPALAAGCTVVLKPAEATPYSALRLAQLVHEAGFSPGVFNVILGDGRTGQALVEHPGVAKVSFTGSTATGKRLIGSAAHDLKRLTLELGGKSPTIILPDADLETAVPGAAQAVFFNSGQICFAGTRLFAPRQSIDRILDGMSKVAKSFKVGAGSDPETLLGPVVSRRQLDSILGRIQAGVQAGAEVVLGGARVAREGYFVEPTILKTSDPDNPAYREEIFGPVLTATPYDDLDELASLANDSEYGLAAHIYTRDLSAAHRLAQRIDAGTVWVNTQLSPDPAIPFGGFKQSGWGRENGEQVFEHYLETKSVIVKIA
ncbi:aldehyde dehydrogenase family protein [Burkholderia sp. Ac-20353]|uniref:aldehyde dehydrogenase family protein n=1 Tax=Burkholderia sp. Ac-20353 TaxID=2703894 RepID=UPI00197BC2B2|nr:aldehyde dehydrogenase family protein [Burkholderia sp. Ac-20353]MBN3788565.1 aldehyde dehydrogenase family protein [Burkholderia sp. Ac-20353]